MTKFESCTEKILDFLSMIPSNSADLEKFQIESLTGKTEIIGLINNDSVSIAQTILTDNATSD
jgi:hypothetical protein